MRKPDVSFVRRERLPSDWLQEGFLSVVPDLVVEVISPSELAGNLFTKIEEYLDAGASLIWIINPRIRTALVFRSNGTFVRLGIDDELNGEDVLPGFKCRLRELFPPEYLAEPVERYPESDE